MGNFRTSAVYLCPISILTDPMCGIRGFLVWPDQADEN